MTADNQTNANNQASNGATAGQEAIPQQGVEGQHSSNNTSAAKQVAANVAGVRKMADDSLSGIATSINELEADYIKVAQPLVDAISQRLYDMVSGRLVYEAIGDNVAMLMGSEVRVGKPRLGERQLEPLSLKRLTPVTSADYSKNALTASEKSA